MPSPAIVGHLLPPERVHDGKCRWVRTYIFATRRRLTTGVIYPNDLYQPCLILPSIQPRRPNHNRLTTRPRNMADSNGVGITSASVRRAHRSVHSRFLPLPRRRT